MATAQRLTSDETKGTPTEEWIHRWQQLEVDHPQRRLLLTAITTRAQRILKTILTRRLPDTPLSQQDLPDLIHRSLELMLNKLSTFDPQRSEFQTWLFYFCGQPVLGEYLRALNYRSVKIGHYRKLLHSPTLVRGNSPVRELIQSMNAQEIVWELQRIGQLLKEGRKSVCVRYGPQLISFSLIEESKLSCVGTTLEHIELKERLGNALKKLPAREYAVIRGVFFEHQPQNQLAEQLNVSTVRIHQLKKRALHRLALILGQDFLD